MDPCGYQTVCSYRMEQCVLEEERCENSLYLVLNKWLLHVLIITCKCLAKAVQIQQTCVVISAAAGKALTSDSDINLIT